MSDHRPGTRVLSLTAACAPPVLYTLWVRPGLLTWGATHDEASGACPGDELIPVRPTPRPLRIRQPRPNNSPRPH